MLETGYPNDIRVHPMQTGYPNGIRVILMEYGLSQWCSGKFALVGTLAWHYDHIPYGYRWGGGGGGFLNEWSFFKGKNRCSNIVVYFLT